MRRISVTLLVAMTLAQWVSAQDAPAKSEEAGRKNFSPYVGQRYPQQVYWGDTHLHTSYSTDAGMIGNRLGPDEAYRFARGEEVVSSGGLRAKLLRPLDFLVISDHAENLGLAPMIAQSHPDLLKSEFGRRVHDFVKNGQFIEAYTAWATEKRTGKDPLAAYESMTRSIWESLTKAAEKYNHPGVFTAVIGFEWTAGPAGSNLHRNVIFRDGKERADRMLPFSSYDSSDPEDLWKWMAAYERQTGGRLLALAHNGNLSNGLMFDTVTVGGRPLDRDYAERRMRWEPLYEITQIKGDGETHPVLSPNDEFADYGTWDRGSFGSAKTPDMLPREYAREALKRGLQLESEIGANPFKFGFVGSTDSHTSLSTSEENNFFGKAAPGEPSAGDDRFNGKIIGYMPDPEGRDYSIYHYRAIASGMAAVWATENTREALFDAMQRKEVYATTGTRITVRLFAGWDFEAADVQRPDFVRDGFSRGVPMGGDLSRAPLGKAPAFMVHALRDPAGANLDRIQIIKGWLDGKGEPHERVYDLSVADGRKIGRNGRCETPVGNTVNVKAANYTNSIGDAALIAYWKDLDFDPAERALYYVRVLEIPTPRWTTYDAAFFGVDLPEGVPSSHQERAYTSPVWYTP